MENETEYFIMSNKLKYVKVYDRIFEMIQDGTFPPGSRLPAEMDLAEQMAVSRMTLRKALALLQEDNLITNKNGIGSFVNRPGEKTVPDESAYISHPVFRCCMEPIDMTELEFRIEPPTNSITKMLGRKSAAVVIADRWYKSQKNPCAYSLSFIPIEVVSEEGIDLNNPDSLLDYLQNKIYQKSKKQMCSLVHSTAGNFTSTKYNLSEKSSFIMIQETLYDGEDRPLAVTKSYIPIQLFKMEIQLDKRM